MPDSLRRDVLRRRRQGAIVPANGQVAVASARSRSVVGGKEALTVVDDEEEEEEEEVAVVDKEGGAFRLRDWG